MSADAQNAAFTLSAALRAAASVRSGGADDVVERLRAAFVDELGEPAVEEVLLYTTRDGGSERYLAPDPSTSAHERIPLPPTAALAVSAVLTHLGHRPEPAVPLDGVVVANAGPVIGLGGELLAGDVFCVVVLPRLPVPAAEHLAPVAVAVRTVLLGGTDAALREHVELTEAHLRQRTADMERTIEQLRAEVSLVDFLQGIGRQLTSQLDLDFLVQEATDAATLATRAAFGSFFYNLVDQYGESYTLYTLSGVPKEAFDGFPMPRNTAVFAPTFHGAGTVRSDDITRDPRYGKSAPHHGPPPGHLPVCSYLAVSVVSPSSGSVLGGFFFAHPEPGRFTEHHERLAEGIAGYAAIALDNARLFARHRTLATELARSMLPTTPAIPGLEIISRYLPAAAGSEVGGDWFDVVELPAGRTGLVIGDVVGRGVGAATVMGQIRTAVRAYALLDMPPADVMAHACRLAGTIERNAFITCLYVVHDPADDTVTVSNAGHLPAVLQDPGGGVAMLGSGLGMPLGVGEVYGEQSAPFPPGSRLTLFTDGLVETRARGLTEGIAELIEHLRGLSGDLDVATDRLIGRLTGGRHDDDVAFLHVRNTAAARFSATLALGDKPRDVSRARAFITERLAEWGQSHLADTAALITSELVTNAILHADSPSRLRVHHDGTRLVIDVADDATTWPKVHDARPDEENHRGLAIVRALATRWGARTTTTGKIVWAEIATPRTRRS
jgi:anti-sigma regulatory factor (Ser/Thr protein kinase)